MSVYSYMLCVPFSQMVSDWNEYWGLCKKARLLRRERDFRYKQVMEKDEETGAQCFCKIKIGEQKMFRPIYRAHYCENFFKYTCDMRCPHGFRHNRYWQMSNELKEVQNALYGFWDKKFQNVK